MHHWNATVRIGFKNFKKLRIGNVLTIFKVTVIHTLLWLIPDYCSTIVVSLCTLLVYVPAKDKGALSNATIRPSVCYLFRVYSSTTVQFRAKAVERTAQRVIPLRAMVEKQWSRRRFTRTRQGAAPAPPTCLSIESSTPSLYSAIDSGISFRADRCVVFYSATQDTHTHTHTRWHTLSLWLS